MVMLGPLAIILVAKKKRIGFIIGLAGQPFFIIAAILSKQWGLQVMAAAFTCSWLYSIYESFLKKKKDP
jgi:hypothetical protein